MSEELVLHDVLEEANYPVYFHEFVESRRACGLQYLCEAMPTERRRSAVAPQRARQTGRAIRAGSNWSSISTSSTARRFAARFVCRSGHDADTRIAPFSRIRWPPVTRSTACCIASPAKPLSPLPELDGNRPEEFVARKDRMTASLRCDRPIEKMSLALLGEIYPRAMPLEELLNAAAARLGR